MPLHNGLPTDNASRQLEAQATEARLDFRSLQLRQQESRVQSAELRAKRRAFQEKERAAKEAEAAVRRAAQ